MHADLTDFSGNSWLVRWVIFMVAKIKNNDIRWFAPIRLKFGFTGVPEIRARDIVRDTLKANWPSVAHPKQCVYVVRLSGGVAVAYGEKWSPVIYIGEGSAYDRLYGHANWISQLLLAVPNVQVDVHVAECVRRNNTYLCEYVEADLIEWFLDAYACLPWFNRQREASKAGSEYDLDAAKEMRKRILAGAGNRFLWAIRPIDQNPTYEHYKAGFRSLP